MKRKKYKEKNQKKPIKARKRKKKEKIKKEDNSAFHCGLAQWNTEQF